ncbi:MAG: hypothetical protein QMD71_02715 [bacterium]|nr:hypothetical protein [bacterium]
MLTTKCFLVAVIIGIGLFGCKKNKSPTPPTRPYGLPRLNPNIDSIGRGWVDTTYYLCTIAEDPERDNISYKFNWGDNSESGWSEFVGSGEEIRVKHSYSTAGTYYAMAKAKDIHNAESDWSSRYTVVITSKSPPPETPVIVEAPDSGYIDRGLTFKVVTTDPDGDKIQYQFEWGDNSVLDWSWEFNSGDTAMLYHTYSDTGKYEVKVKAKDIHGSVSGWSAPCTTLIIFPPPPYPPGRPTLLNVGYPRYYLQTPFEFQVRCESLVEGDTALSVQFEWGDGEFSSWIITIPGAGGIMTASALHAFVRPGAPVAIRAKAKDRYGQASAASVPCTLTIINNFVSEWLGLGNPFGIAVSGDSVYVVDHLNHEVKIFSRDGNLETTIGSTILELPMYVATDAEFVYVTDEYNQVYKFRKADGGLETHWGSQGSGNGQFRVPTGIAVDDEHVYVVDSENKRIQKFNKNGVYVGQWPIYGKYARGLSVNRDTLYLASNFGNNIQIFTTTGNNIGTIGSSGSGDGQLKSPCDVAVYGDFIYVADSDNHRIQKFTKGGAFVIRWGCNGVEQGQFFEPQGITVDENGYIYVVDTWNNRVQKFIDTSKEAL